jgi:hypothetical protein
MALLHSSIQLKITCPDTRLVQGLLECSLQFPKSTPLTNVLTHLTQTETSCRQAQSYLHMSVKHWWHHVLEKTQDSLPPIDFFDMNEEGELTFLPQLIPKVSSK